MNQDLYVSKVYLLSVPLENDYKNTLYFASKENQQSYFQGKKKFTFDDFYYIRKDNVIRVKTHYDTLVSKGVNYLMYQNSAYSNKWFYCFITDIKYINDECTELIIETDVMQTWMFDITIKPSFVEREHVDDDTIGLHTLDEGLDKGEYINNGLFLNVEGNKKEECAIVLAYSDYIEGNFNVTGFNNNGVYSGVRYAPYKMNGKGITDLNELLTLYDKNAMADGIVSIFMAPKWLFNEEENDRISIKNTSGNPISESIKIPKLPHFIDNFTKAGDEYIPENKKLLTYPYIFMNIYNGAGSNAIYKPELFSDKDYYEFKKYGVVCPGCSITLIPIQYDEVKENYQCALSGAKYPICSWVSDTYTNWQIQNAGNNIVSTIAGGLTVAAGVGLMATGAGTLIGAGMVAGGVHTIANTMVANREASLVPDQAKGNTNVGDVMTGLGINTFQYYYTSIKVEYAKMIDSFFHMYGYKVNRVKLPNTNHRSKWWFTKTIDINIDGNIPGDDMQKIKDCYNNGITFWRYENQIQYYIDSNGKLMKNDIVNV